MTYLLFFIIQASAIQFLHILTSQDTEKPLLESLVTSLDNNCSGLVEIVVIEISQETTLQNILVNSNIIIDITSRLTLNSEISRVASELEFIHIIVDKPSGSFQEWSFFTLLPEESHYEALNSILTLFNWYQYALIQSETFESIELSNIFQRNNIDQKINLYSFPNSQSQNVADDLVGVQVKPSGLLNIVILNEGEGAKKIISSIINKKLYKINSGILLTSKGLWGADEDGLIIIAEKGLETAISLHNYKVLSVLKILENVDFTNDSKYAIKSQLRAAFNNNNQPIPEFSIINIQNSTRKIIGSIEGRNASIQTSPIFPGNTLNYPDSKNAVLKVSIASGNSNYNGVRFYSNIWIKTGALFAIGYANSIQAIPNYNILTHETDCSAELYNHNFSYNCLAKEVENFGPFYIPSINSDVCIGTINDFHQLGIKIPMIADGCPSPLLTSTTNYPKFTRTVKTFSYHAGIIPNLMSIFGWKDIVVIYENSTFGHSLYNSFLINAKAAGINILNDEDKRMIKAYYSPADFDNYAYVVSHAIKTTGRIFAFFVFMDNNEMFYLMSQFYDMGLRRGDAVFIIYEQASWFTQISAFWEKEILAKISELIEGSISLSPGEFIGTYGETIEKMLLTQVDESKMIGAIGTCYSFNAAMLGIYTLNTLIQYGEDYTDPDIMNSAIRKQKIIGCSGKVKIAVDSNEPNDEIITINNIIYNRTTNVFLDSAVGYYDIGKNPLITMKGKMIWPNGTTIYPTDKRLDQYDCAFDLHLIQKSKIGKMLYYLLIWTLSLISLTFSLVFLKKCWKYKFPMITQKKLSKFGDFVKHSYIVIDFIQLLALSPKFDWNYWGLTYVLYALIGDASEFTFTQAKIWMSIYLALGFIFLWLVSCLFIHLDFDEKLAKLDFFWMNYIIWTIKQFLPFFANFGVIPIVMILFTLFKCENGSGDSITESYWEYDCKTYCWKDKHLIFAVISIFSLIFFMISTVYFRPRWEFLDDDQNVVINPHYLVSRGIFQIVLVALYLTLKDYSEALFGLAYVVIMSILLIYAWRFEPSNHNIANLWILVSLFSIIWSGAISSIYWSNDNFKGHLFWNVLRLSGWLVIACVTLFVNFKLMENPLYSPKANSISLYFLFQFTSAVSAKDISKSVGSKYLIVSKTNIDTSQHYNASQQVDSAQPFFESQPVESCQNELSID